jgi:hypothetical protein
MIKISSERQVELLAEYHAKKQALEIYNAELEAMQKTQREKQEAFWAKMNKPVYVNHTEKTYKCAGCNATIPKGSRALVKCENVNVSGSGWTGQTLTRHYCAVCSGSLSKVTL